jgi:hypothetical protein
MEVGEIRDLSIDLDKILNNMPIGSISRSMTYSLYGLNMHDNRAFLPSNRDRTGYTFFTKPQLNLSANNVIRHRSFLSLLTDVETSYQRYTRLNLDPRLASMGSRSGQVIINGLEDAAVTSIFVNPNMPFIPLLTNTITSLSGWPDITVPVSTSSTGLYGEEHNMVDGVTNHYESYDIDVNFKNIRGNPLIYLFYIWVRYQSLVFEGVLTPYTDFILENELDYNTRIYRVVLQPNKTHVSYVACTGASFPVNVPLGNLLDFNVENTYNITEDINIRFRSTGFIAFEDIVKFYFNSTVAIFNPDLKALLEQDMSGSISGKSSEAILRDNPKEVYMVKGYARLPTHLVAYIENAEMYDNNPYYNLRYKAVPYINLHTNEFEWWVKISDIPGGVPTLMKFKNLGG